MNTVEYVKCTYTAAAFGLLTSATADVRSNYFTAESFSRRDGSFSLGEIEEKFNFYAAAAALLKRTRDAYTVYAFNCTYFVPTRRGPQNAFRVHGISFPVLRICAV